jgi:hypothetical protein
MSGFYEKEIPGILTEASRYSLVQVSQDVKENWASLLLTKA